MTKVLLYSGGTDSWLINEIEKPDIRLFFDLGTASSNAELNYLKYRKADVIVDRTLRGLGDLERQDGSFIVPLRNLFFITRAAEYGEHIILGTNKTDAHNDKTLKFAQLTEDLLNYYYGPSLDGLSEIKDIKVDFSYKQYTKPELLKLYMSKNGNIEKYINESFSCYTPIKTEDGYKECHNCKVCFNKMMSLFLDGYELPKGYLASFIPYLENLYNKINNGTNHRYFQTEDIERALTEAYKDNESSSIS